jgi:hypothetical protein
MAITKNQIINRVVGFYGVDTLVQRLDIELPELQDPVDVVKRALGDLRPRQLLVLLLPALSDAEIQQLDQVKSNRLVRPNRADLESAALGDMTELERERAAAKAAKDANAVSPSVEEVAKLYQAPTVEPVHAPNGGVAGFTRKKWIAGADGRPVEVELDG